MARGNRGRNRGASQANARIAANRVDIPSHYGGHRIRAPRVQVPDWRALDAMPLFERSLALELREQIWQPSTNNIIVTDASLGRAVCNQSPLPKVFMDLEVFPPSMGMVMQDGTRVSESFGSAYSNRMVRKVEIALNWHRTLPFESRSGRTNNAWRGQVAGPTEAERARMAEVEAARRAAYEAHVAEERAAEAAAEAARKARRDDERAADAAKGEKPYTAALPQTPKDKPTGRQRTEEEQRAHDAHVLPEQKAARSSAFDARQEQAHLDRLAREAKARSDAAAKLVSDMDKEDAAASHVVPAPPSLSERFEAALGL